MVYKTIGSGGDYANFYDAVRSIHQVDITDDYTFDIISDFDHAQNMNINSYLHLMGHTVRFTCSHNEANDPDIWYTVSVTQPYSVFIYCGNNSKVINGKIVFDYIKIKYVSGTRLSTVALLSIRPNSWEYYDIHGYAEINNVILDGNGNCDLGWGIGNVIGETQHFSLFNIKMYDFKIGIQFPNPLNEWPVVALLENISIARTKPVAVSGGAGIVLGRRLLQIKNLMVIDPYNIGAWPCFTYIGASEGSGVVSVKNCASSDGTVTAEFPWTATNSVPNIVPVNEFISLDPTSADFLKLKVGTRSNVTFIPGSLALGQAGTANTIGFTEDISGMPVPGIDSLYSIGCHEQQYLYIAPDRQTYKKFILDSGAVYKNFTDVDNPGTLLGATRGGSRFIIEQDCKDIGYDGAAGAVKGARINTKVACKLTCNFVEITKEILRLSLPGCDYELATTEAPTEHLSFYRNREIENADYIDNVVLVAQISGSNDPVICGVKNALMTSNFDFKQSDDDEASTEITFTGHYLLDDLESDPFILMYPTELTTTDMP